MKSRYFESSTGRYIFTLTEDNRLFIDDKVSSLYPWSELKEISALSVLIKKGKDAFPKPTEKKISCSDNIIYYACLPFRLFYRLLEEYDQMIMGAMMGAFGGVCLCVVLFACYAGYFEHNITEKVERQHRQSIVPTEIKATADGKEIGTYILKEK